MANQEGAGRGIFGITAPTRERTATPVREREKELAPPPTPQEVRDANAGKLAPRGILKKVLDTAKKHPVVTTGATLAAIAGGVAAFEAYQGNIPGIHRSVEEAIPTHFDNNADHQLLQAGINANPIASTELNTALKDSIKPLEEKSFPQVEMLLPVQLNPNERVEISKFWVRSAFNPIAEKTDNLVFGKEITIPKKGDKIIVPVENAEIFQISPYVVDGQSYFNGVLIRFKGPDNMVYELAIKSSNEVTDLGAMDVIKNAPTIGDDEGYSGPIMHKDTINLKGLALPPGTPILISSKDNAVIRFHLAAYSPTYPKGLPSGFNLIQDKQDPAKIIYLPATP